MVSNWRLRRPDRKLSAAGGISPTTSNTMRITIGLRVITADNNVTTVAAAT